MTKAILVASLVRQFADHVERTFAFKMAREQNSFKGDAAIFNKAMAEGRREFSEFLTGLSINTADGSGGDQVSAYDLAAGELLKLRAEERARMAPRRELTKQAWARKRQALADALKARLAATKSAAVAAAH